MNRREFVKLCGVAAAGAGFSCRAAEGGRAPNMLFIIVDDLGWKDVSYNERREWQTPNIDRIAAEGMEFTDAYSAAPLCSPTRASIMTGKYPARLHLTNWIPGRKSRKSQKLVEPKWSHSISLDEVTFPDVLKADGYRTGFLGKWHVGETRPKQHGFDDIMLFSEANYVKRFYGDDIEVSSPRGRFWAGVTLEKPDPPVGVKYMTDLKAEQACDWLEKNKDNKFMLYFSTNVVHVPIGAMPGLVKKYRDKGLEHPEYAGMVEHLDDCVGVLLDKLDELGLAENTVVFFISDNGGYGKYTSNLPLKGQKSEPTEGGIRVPMTVRWPGVVKPGSVCGEPVITMDFYPTFLEIAGLPAKPEQHKDGVSLVPLLKGGSIEREAIYWHYPHYNNMEYAQPNSVIRMGDYKLIEWLEDGRLELYDLREDIGEQNNLADKKPDKARTMHQMLKDWRKSVGAQMPTPNPDYKG